MISNTIAIFPGKKLSVMSNQHFDDGSEKNERSLDNLISYPDTVVG